MPKQQRSKKEKKQVSPPKSLTPGYIVEGRLPTNQARRFKKFLKEQAESAPDYFEIRVLGRLDKTNNRLFLFTITRIVGRRSDAFGCVWFYRTDRQSIAG